MARPKKTTKENIEEKSTTKKSTTKKSTKMHKLTYKPRLTASEVAIFSLRETKEETVGNTVRKTDFPIVPGLPMELVIKKDEIIEVTDKQLDALMKLGIVDTEEIVAKRIQKMNEIERQLRESPESRLSAAMSSLYVDNLYLLE